MIEIAPTPQRNVPRCQQLLFLLTSIAAATNTCQAFVFPSNRVVGSASGTYRRHAPSRLSSSRLSYSADPFESESSEERGRRMALVRELRRTFYANETGVPAPRHGVYRNMPLWRGNWTELPGFQHVTTVSDPNYVNLLMKVVSSSQPWYFGHVFLPASGNIDDDAYRLEPGTDAALTGTLMQVSDYAQLDDGRLKVVTQALGRFTVVETMRHGSPYGVATVELLPDGEMVQAHVDEAEMTASSFDFARNDDTRGAACAGAVAEAAEWRSYEFKPVRVELADKEDASSSPNGGGAVVPPVSNLDSGAAASASGDADAVHFAMEDYLSQSPDDAYQSECSLADDFDEGLQDRALDVEREVWVELDTLAVLLSRLNPKANTEMPIPPQIMGLLPPSTADPNRRWPKGFRLARYARKMTNVYSILEKNPRLNIDDDQRMMETAADGYPALRRARRLSYVVWALLDTIWDEEREGGQDEGGITRQDILEMDSTSQRLDAAKSRVQEINSMLRQLLEQH